MLSGSPMPRETRAWCRRLCRPRRVVEGPLSEQPGLERNVVLGRIEIGIGRALGRRARTTLGRCRRTGLAVFATAATTTAGTAPTTATAFAGAEELDVFADDLELAAFLAGLLVVPSVEL